MIKICLSKFIGIIIDSMFKTYLKLLNKHQDDGWGDWFLGHTSKKHIKTKLENTIVGFIFKFVVTVANEIASI